MLRIFCLFILMGIIISCGNNKKIVPAQSTKESTLSPATDDSIDIAAASVKSDDYYDNFQNPFDTLIGCWAAIREGNITITFSEDSTFEFYDYNHRI